MTNTKEEPMSDEARAAKARCKGFEFSPRGYFSFKVANANDKMNVRGMYAIAPITGGRYKIQQLKPDFSSDTTMLPKIYKSWQAARKDLVHLGGNDFVSSEKDENGCKSIILILICCLIAYGAFVALHLV